MAISILSPLVHLKTFKMPKVRRQRDKVDLGPRSESVIKWVAGSQIERGDNAVLTFEAVIVTCQILVVLLPAIQTHFFPTWSTSVVPEIVVPWFADDVAISSVVWTSTDQSVIILQLGIFAINPIWSGVETLWFCDPMKQSLIVTCK